MKTFDNTDLAKADDTVSSATNELRRIFLVEDHPITRAGLCAIINREADLTVCGETEDAASAIDLIPRLCPELVITDIALKTGNGVELIKNILALLPNLAILVMSMHDERVYAERVLRAGAKGYLMKKEATDNLIPAMRSILGGDIYLSDQMREKLLSGILGKRRNEEAVFPLETLSDREVEVFHLIGNGYTTKEIAGRLKLSPKTIDSYREHLKIKLNLTNGAELLRHAIRWSRLENTIEN
jgi:DNA-binding NarL/FixJ family response regulator